MKVKENNMKVGIIMTITIRENYLKEYLNADNITDVCFNKNANNTKKSFNHFMHQVSSPIMKKIGRKYHKEKMAEIFSEKEADIFWEAVDNGYLYFHDADKMLIPYCYATSVSMIAYMGRPYGQLHSVPPKRSDSFVAQVIEYVMDLSQEFAGAIAIGDFFIEYSKFTIKENKSDKERINDFQKLVHVINNSFRVSGDSPFTNISIFDKYLIKNTFNITDEVLLDEIMKNQIIYLKFFDKGDPTTNLPYRFPITTVNFFTDNKEIKDNDFFDIFLNLENHSFFNIYLTNDIGKLASCCRLISDLKDMAEHLNIDSFGNGGASIGSHRVITLNLAKIEQDEQRLKYYFKLATKGLKAHRELLRELIDMNFLKFFKPLNWIDLDRHFFSTVGYIGLYEATQSVHLMEIYLKKMGELAKTEATVHNMPINLEQIPAESASIKLAQGTEYDMLSNQYLPLWIDYDISERLSVAGRLDKLSTGGAITHINVAQKPTREQVKIIIEQAVKLGVHHFAINEKIGICKNGHATYGKYCHCGEEISDYITRIVGYFTPVSSWNAGRKIEFKKRVFKN